MRYDLTAMTRRANPGMRRNRIVIRDIIPPAVMATDLYRSCYLPVIELWERATPRIVAEYERALSALTTDSPADLQARLDAANSELERLFILLDASLREWGVQTERWQRGKWRGAVLSATNVDILTLIGPEDVRETLGTYLEWNAALIRDVSAEAKRRISNAVFSGLTERKPAREVAKEIREAVDMSRARSVRIASDQLSKVTSALADERQREAGIEKVKWRSSHKLHPRKWHAARDGKLYYLESRKAVEGDEVVPADDWAGRPPFCGCRTQAVIDLS